MSDVKICGLRDDSSLAAAIAGGAAFVGLVFFPKSPRNVGLDQAAALAAHARGRTKIVAVTVNADDSLLSAIADAVRPDFIQLHGDEPPARVEAVKALTGAGVIKALPIATAADFAPAAAFTAVADMLLFDAKAPADAALPGGNGAAFDWRLLAGRTLGRPWFLSGGLTPESVRQAITESGAKLVDVSSGVESAPGVKDAERIARFLSAARGA